MTTDEKVKKMASIVFDIPLERITDATSYETDDEWDSLHHMMLIGELEKEFNVTFSVDEAISIGNIKAIKDILIKKLGSQDVD